MKIAVTGGSGFIGGQIASELAKSHEVVSIDIAPPNKAEGFSFHRADLSSYETTQRVLKNVDVVYHVAGAVLEQVRIDPFGASGTNVEITRNVVEASYRNGVKKILFASTFYVYDGIDPNMTVNEATPLSTIGMELFGATKVFGETLLKEYSKKYGMKYVILRFGSAYGPGGQGSNVIKAFLDSAKAGKTIDVWGPGNRRNQYTYVKDLAKGCVLSLSRENEIYNLISPEETTIRELTETISKKVPTKVQFDLGKKEGASMPYMSSRKAIKELGWTTISVDEGIDLILSHDHSEKILAA